MESRADIDGLFEKFLAEQCQPVEIEQLMRYFGTAEEGYLYELIHTQYVRELEGEELPIVGAHVYQAIHARINPVSRSLWPRIAGVSTTWKIAAAVAVMTLGLWLYNISNTPRHPEFISGSPLANDIVPGRNTAALTLANGQTIQLSDAKTGVIIGEQLTYNDKSEVAFPNGVGERLSLRFPRNDEVEMISASTPRGGTYQITLPDGTKAWLNADSKLAFPSSFAGSKTRTVTASGEIYFEVAHNKAKPFIVSSRGQIVEVLGTHFNINAYPDEGLTKTTLLEGSVNINGTILKPSQQAIVSGSTIKITQADMEEAIAWKEGYFRFNGQKIGDVMNELARWYDVDVSYEDKVTEDGFNGRISRYKNISQVLRMLENTGLVHFKVEGRRVSVLK